MVGNTTQMSKKEKKPKVEQPQPAANEESDGKKVSSNPQTPKNKKLDLDKMVSDSGKDNNKEQK